VHSPTFLDCIVNFYGTIRHFNGHGIKSENTGEIYVSYFKIRLCNSYLFHTYGWLLFLFALSQPPPSVSVPVYSFAVPVSSKQNQREGGIYVVEDENGNLITKSLSDVSTSMNIVTFCSPVNVAAPKLWMISLYKGTMTKLSFLKNKVGVLQLLTPEQSELVPLLGKRSSLEKDCSKENLCASAGFTWSTENIYNGETLEEFHDLDIKLLPKCASYIFLKLCDEQPVWDAGDHVVALCKVVGTGIWEDNHPSNGNVRLAVSEDQPQKPLNQESVMYTGYLRSIGVL